MFEYRYISIFVVITIINFFCNNVYSNFDDQQQVHIEYSKPEHSLNNELFNSIKLCDTNVTYCTENLNYITIISTKIANEYANLLLYDRVEDIFNDILYYMTIKHIIGKRSAYILSIVCFTQGRHIQAENYWKYLSLNELSNQRSIAAQAILTSKSYGYVYMIRYLTNYRNSFESTLNTIMNHTITNNTFILKNQTSKSFIFHNNTIKTSDEINTIFLSLLLNEAQGSNIKQLTIRIDDSLLAMLPILPKLDGKLQFDLGIGLAKLGLFELSMRHINMVATQWDAPLYVLRSKLIFATVHTSIRSLAAAVNEFESQAESILLDDFYARSSLSHHICESFEDISLFLHVLPLLHLTGFSSPLSLITDPPFRSSYSTKSSSAIRSTLGYSMTSLPLLLSELYTHICLSSHTIKNYNPHTLHVDNHHLLSIRNNDATVLNSSIDTYSYKKQHSNVIKIGIVSGSFDHISGKIIIGLLESIPMLKRKSTSPSSSNNNIHIIFIAMCFPTPRDGTTDRINQLFDKHVNLSPTNRTLVINKIIAEHVDFLLYTDIALDSRIFALAHERLAPYQGILWHYGGTMGIPSIDFYFMPEIFWSHSHCGTLTKSSVPPQDLFTEQVVLFQGLPYIPTPVSVLSLDEIRALLQTRYLLPTNNQTHLYIFPGTVRHLHPEFDHVIDIILQTDPVAMIVLAVVKIGRDNMPATHLAVRHDLMHPAMPVAAVAKCLRRLRGIVGVHNIDRIRILPPLDEVIYRGLLKISVAVLDPFPVGMHIPVLQAILDQVPVITSFTLQECTNSHAYNIYQYLNITKQKSHYPQQQHKQYINDKEYLDLETQHIIFPNTPEEYGVLAVRIQKEILLRTSLILIDKQIILALVKESKSGDLSYGNQFFRFMKSLFIK